MGKKKRELERDIEKKRRELERQNEGIFKNVIKKKWQMGKRMRERIEIQKERLRKSRDGKEKEKKKRELERECERKTQRKNEMDYKSKRDKN